MRGFIIYLLLRQSYKKESDNWGYVACMGEKRNTMYKDLVRSLEA
jgi:hypothetical protein